MDCVAYNDCVVPVITGTFNANDAVAEYDEVTENEDVSGYTKLSNVADAEMYDAV